MTHDTLFTIPFEPCQEQIEAGLDQLPSDSITADEMTEAYKAMLLAAQTPEGIEWADRIPEREQRHGRKGTGQYPFWQLEVGQFFRVPDDKRTSCRVMAQRINKTGERYFLIDRRKKEQWRIYRIS